MVDLDSSVEGMDRECVKISERRRRGREILKFLWMSKRFGEKVLTKSAPREIA